MRTSWKAAGAIWAIALAQTLCARATLPADGQVTDAADLADEINRGAVSTVNIPPGSYSVTEPLYVNRNLTLTGQPAGTPPLATEVVIRPGTVTTDNCFGNAVKSGDFEAGSLGIWTETTAASSPPIITKDSSQAYNNSDYYARFSRSANVPTGVPVGSMDFTGPNLDLTSLRPLPGQITESLEWAGTSVPAKVNPFPVTLTHSQTLSINPASYIQTVDLYSGTVGPFSITFWLYIPKYAAGDSLMVKDGGTALPLVTPLATVTEISSTTASVSDYQGAYTFVKVDLSALTPVAHTITLEAKFNSNIDDPSIFLVGAIVRRSNTVSSTLPPGGDGSDMIIDPAPLPVVTTPAFAYPTPPTVIPVGQAIGTATNPFSNATICLGGICKPRLTFSAVMPQIGNGAGEYIQAFYSDGVTNPSIGPALTDATLTPTCQTFSGPLPTGLGAVGFKVNIYPTIAAPTIFVIDDVCVTVSSPTLESISALFAPKNCNILLSPSNPGFDSGTAGWTVTTAAPITLTLSDLLSTLGACNGTAAVFDPLKLPIPPVSLYIWARVVQGGTATDTLTVKIDDHVSSKTQTLLDGSDAVTPGFAMLPPVDVTEYAGKTVDIWFTGKTSTDTIAPAIFVLGGVQLSNTVVAGPDPGTAQYLDGAGFYAFPDSAYYLDMIFNGFYLYQRVVRFGGIHQPALEYQVTAPTKGDPGDSLALLFDGSSTPLLTALDVTADCQQKTFLLPSAWLSLGGQHTFGFRSTIKANAPNTETVFELDDLRPFTHVSNLLTTLDSSTFPPGEGVQPWLGSKTSEDFEGIGTDWSAEAWFGPLPSIIGPSIQTPLPCDTTNVAVFKALTEPPPQTVTLAQGSVQVLPQTKEMTFWVKMPTSGTSVDVLECITTLGGVDATVYSLKGDTAGYSVYRQETVDMTMYAGQTIDLRFIATLADGATPASFALDSICLAPPGSSALLTIGSGVTTMSKIKVSGGTTGVLVKSGALLNLYRCLVDGATVAGVELAGGATANMASCSFDGNTIGVSNAGTAAIFQSTMLGGTAAVQGSGGSTQVAACLCTSGILGTGVSTYRNWVAGDNFTGENATLPNIPAASIAPVFLSGWPGQLDPAVLVRSGTSQTALTAAGFVVPALWNTDFESEGRSGSDLGIGADEQLAAVQISDWSCAVTPVVTGPNTAPVRITVTLTTSTGGDLSGIDPASLQLRLAPEMPVWNTPGDINTDGLYLYWPLTVNGPNTAYADVKFTDTFPNGICVDGLMTVGLDVAGAVIQSSTGNCSFLVDTVAPELDLYGFPPTVTTANTLVPATVTDGPGNWPPRTMPIPKTGNSLADGDVHCFIRNIAELLLDLSVYSHFIDRFPVDGSGNMYMVTRAGFDPATASTLTGFTLTPTSTTTTPSTGFPVSLDVSWEFAGIAGYGHWPFKPDMKDRGGNTAVVRTLPGGSAFKTLDHSLYAWWQTNPVAQFDASSTTNNQLTAAPHFGWSVTPPTGLSLQEEAPCFPAAAFQIWAVDPAAGASVSLTGGWSWLGGPTNNGPITGATVAVPVNKSIDQILLENRANSAQSKQLLIAIIGGDEAGNVQAYDASLTGVDTRTWQNGQSPVNVAVDTDLNVKLSHADKNGATLAGRNFGSMARVPLPSLAEAAVGVHVEADVSINARYPAAAASAAAASVRVEWSLYEDGALVAQGGVFSPGDANKSFGFPLPDVLLYSPGADIPIGNAHLMLYGPLTTPAGPTPNAFLRLGPDNIKNRMGDEASPTGGGRQREVRYMLVAQTVAATPTGEIADPTPASVEFSIYVRDAVDKVREEQPVRIYERK